MPQRRAISAWERSDSSSVSRRVSAKKLSSGMSCGFFFMAMAQCLPGESEDFDAGNGVEVWVAMHEDETRRVRDSGDESIGQRQTAWCGIPQTDRSKGGFGVHGKESG